MELEVMKLVGTGPDPPYLVLVVKLEQNWQTYWRTRLFLASMMYTTLSRFTPPSSSPLSAEVSEPTGGYV